MRLLAYLVLLLTVACQIRPPVLQDAVYLTKDIIYPVSSIADSELETQLTHQVTYYSMDNQRFDYLVQLDISAKQDYMALVATSLLGVPLIAFEMNGKKLSEIKRLSEKLPTAKRLVVDLQLMLWPLEQLNALKGLRVSETCENQCIRMISINQQPIAKILYSNNLLNKDIVFENLTHQYRMTIKNL